MNCLALVTLALLALLLPATDPPAVPAAARGIPDPGTVPAAAQGIPDFAAVPGAGQGVPDPTAVESTPDPTDPRHWALAAAYNAKNAGISLLVMVDGQVVFEDYPNGGAIDRAHELASGTKSFCGIIATAAAADELLTLDEKVADTITEWQDDPLKSQITIRQLLSLTSGIQATSFGQRVPTYADAIELPAKFAPGERFEYGPVPFQVFGEVVRRKLDGESPLDYLKRRVLEPIGLEVGRWRHGADGNPHLPSGAALTARNWAKFGELVRCGGSFEGQEILERQRLDECLVGTEANPAYGLSWWLNREVAPETRAAIPQLNRGTDDMWGKGGIANDLVFAAGAGKQRLYVSRELKLVVIRQAAGIAGALAGARPAFSDAEFLARLLRGTDAAGNPLESDEPDEAKSADPGNEAAAPLDQRAQQIMAALDGDGDGFLTLEELPPRLQQVFDRIDADGDGRLSTAEVAEARGRLRRK